MTGILNALIAGVSGAVKDTYFNLVSLLLPGNGTNGAQNNTFLDSSTNNFTITRNGNTTQGTFSPFSQTGWGGSFNTSTTYLTVTDTANLRFGSSNFTIEAWVYRNASGATQTIASKGASTPTGWVFQISSADKLVFTDTSTSITGTTSITANTWTYVAVVRAGTGANQTTLYVNGTSDGTGTSATNFNQTSNMLIGADRSTTNFANGYISNLRLSNTNRTISSTPTTALTADANTIFLSLNLNCFQYTDSTAAYTNISVTGTPSVVAFSPFNPTASWSAATYGGSGYFDGSGDYLSVASNTAFAFGTGEWTMECWVYASAIDVSSVFFSCGTNGTQFGTNASGNLAIAQTAVTFEINSSTALPLNQWNHIAAVRNSSNSCSIFLNGTRIANATITTNYSSSGTAYVNYNAFSIGSDFTGYMSGLRVVKGTAVYDPTQTTITVPTSPPTAITNTSLLLNFTNAGIYDATSKNDLETVGNAQISTTQFQFAPSSMAFDGNGDYLIMPDAQTGQFLTGDFTVEYWCRFGSQGTNYAPQVGTLTSASPSGTWRFGTFTNNGGVYLAYHNGSSYVDVQFGSTAYNDNTWRHFALTRSGTTVRAFVNGTQVGTNQTVSQNFNSSNKVSVGAELLNPTYFNGYIQDLRITKGYARYTANFTAPTAAFPTL